MISFQKKILGTLHGVSVPKLPIVTGAPETDQRVCQEEGAEQGQLRTQPGLQTPQGLWSSRGQGRVNQGDKGKGGETWSSKGQGFDGDRLLVVQEVELGASERGPKGCAKDEKEPTRSSRLLTATPMGPV